MPIKILYIHGYGSTGNSQTVQGLRKFLDEKAIIHAPQFSNDLSSFEKIKQNIEHARKHREEFRPHIVIGSSFGGFITTFLDGSFRIIINPCLRPSERLDTLSPNMSQEDIDKLKEFESSHVSNIDIEDRFFTYGLFGLNDELFSYLSLFEKIYRKDRVYTMPSGHRIDIVNIENHLIPLIWEVKKDQDNFNPEGFNFCGDNGLFDDID